MFPARLVSYHENVVPTEPPNAIPSHFFIHLPKFTEADVREFQRAYLDDTTVYLNGITIREIYCVLIGDNGLEFQVVLHHESGGHQVVVVHELDEGLQSALSIDLLFAHALDNTAGRALNADHEGVSELLVLNET